MAFPSFLTGKDVEAKAVTGNEAGVVNVRGVVAASVDGAEIAGIIGIAEATTGTRLTGMRIMGRRYRGSATDSNERRKNALREVVVKNIGIDQGVGSR